ncbi:MAG: TrkA C-terminal domain-containing protein [Planctomycetota bacterium]
MAELVALLVVFVFALVAIRAGALALERTGLPRDVARFQAQSAFMHVGFTTSEAEHVVSHPVRRQVLQGLMWAGFGSSTAAMGTIAAALIRSDDRPEAERLALLLVGVLVIALMWRLRSLERVVDWSIQRALRGVRWLAPSQVTELLELGDHVIGQIAVGPRSWLADHTLRELRLTDEGVLVLTLTRAGGPPLRSPGPETLLGVGDVLVCYGSEAVLKDLGVRERGVLGAAQHREAAEAQAVAVAQEVALDPVQRAEAPKAEARSTGAPGRGPDL